MQEYRASSNVSRIKSSIKLFEKNDKELLNVNSKFASNNQRKVINSELLEEISLIGGPQQGKLPDNKLV
jgi:hypothetical protein